MREVRISKCINGFKQFKNPVMGLGDAGWDWLLTDPDSAVYRPRRRRGAVNSATPSQRPALASWEGHGCAQWLRQLTA